MNTVKINGEHFHYTLDGKSDAPVLMLSNSLGTRQTMWSAQVDALRQSFRVLTYDTRGHGALTSPPGPYTLELLGTDVTHLLDHLDISSVLFCGISMGGIIGQWLAVHAPQRVTKLVICNSAARIGTNQAWLERAALVRRQGIDSVADSAASRWFTEAFIASNKTAVASLIDTLRTVSAEGYASCCEALAHADMRDEISKITAPTLIIAGQYDPVTTPEDADFMARRISDAQRVDLPASHLSNIEASQAFNNVLAQFLKT